ncbi:hypothetical protein GCM10010156_66140 [Planobispora rosea]|uniref:Uncharacterized protein n=1 Tax=Planobispora rosea TaxID=35762 RepID=A0A8J3WG26_PLARO|nr:hypothetical protein [Planobispora rosea]GGS98794.1 hypothetical protein GCM10010156_66140 [Planobispora rosea]GIH87978.1 hypothetical protein Pro02_63860 [Planobispora rosea]
MRSFTLTRTPRYAGYDSLEGTSKLAPDEFLIIVDGIVLGGTYWCSYNPQAAAGWGEDDGGLSGPSWASWGPRGLSCGHPTREAAEHAQLRAYVTEPSGYDRELEMIRAEREAEAARRQAEQEAEDERREIQQRRERLGDDEPGPVIWKLPAFHALYADPAEVAAVAAWLEANGMEDASGLHEVRIEQRATRRAALYYIPQRMRNGRNSQVMELHAVTVVSDPPPITVPDRPDLHPVLAEHEPATSAQIDFGRSFICVRCTSDAKATLPAQIVPWPCPMVEKAITNDPAKEGAPR